MEYFSISIFTASVIVVQILDYYSAGNVNTSSNAPKLPALTVNSKLTVMTPSTNRQPIRLVRQPILHRSRRNC